MNERPFKLGERVLITGTGATYCNKAFRDFLGFADIDTSICYDWSNDMPVSLIREIKGSCCYCKRNIPRIYISCRICQW